MSAHQGLYITLITNEYFFNYLVSHDINHNTYHWLRKPHIQNDIILDNHEVQIREYNFTYELDGKEYNILYNKRKNSNLLSLFIYVNFKRNSQYYNLY